jgi:2-polyprenyl-3-methyl-5-hydroxy-6-metoxy-1,4-benzoquinol methylase
VEGVIADAANPLLRIALSIQPGSVALDIGAGSGLLPRVASRLGRTIVFDGIEPNSHAAGIARQHYRHFHEGYLSEARFVRDGRRYDYIVLADVIEHAADPQALLQEVIQVMQPGCRLLISVPNVSFAAVRIALLNGDFDYVDSGLLERTHLRFFTRRTLETLILRSGLHLNRLCLLQRDPRSTEIDLTRYRHRPLWRMRGDELAFTYQFLAEVSHTASTTKVERYRAAGGIGSRLRRAAVALIRHLKIPS